MNNLLSTEQKYNKKYMHHAIFAYILLLGLIIITIKVVWTIFTSRQTINSDSVIWFIIFFVYLGFFYISVYILGIGVRKNDDSYGIGYLTEELVGTKLAALGNEYLIIHDLQKGIDIKTGNKKGNIDHVVIGPTGVFVIDSKSNKNQMIYYKNNVRKLSELAEKFMNQVAGNALWVHEEIKKKLGIDLFVYGMVVRPFNESRKIETYCKNRVCIMDGDSVYEHIKQFEGRLSGEEIDKINYFLCEIKRKNKSNK